jgi:hypothetical protein
MRRLRYRITLIIALPTAVGLAGACPRPSPLGRGVPAALAATPVSIADEIDVCLAALQHRLRSWPTPFAIALVAERPAMSDIGRDGFRYIRRRLPELDARTLADFRARQGETDTAWRAELAARLSPGRRLQPDSSKVPSDAAPRGRADLTCSRAGFAEGGTPALVHIEERIPLDTSGMAMAEGAIMLLERNPNGLWIVRRSVGTWAN